MQSGTTTATKTAQEMTLTARVPRNTRISDVMGTFVWSEANSWPSNWLRSSALVNLITRQVILASSSQAVFNVGDE